MGDDDKKKGKGKKSENSSKKKKIDDEVYEEELLRLQGELCKLQKWVVHKGLKVVVIFEGRDTAGKGGVIKRIIIAMFTPRDLSFH